MAEMWQREHKLFIDDRALAQSHDAFLDRLLHTQDLILRHAYPEPETLDTVTLQNATLTVYSSIVKAETSQMTRYDAEGKCDTLDGFLDATYAYQSMVNMMNIFNIMDLLSELNSAHVDLKNFPALQLQLLWPKISLSDFPSNTRVMSGVRTSNRAHCGMVIMRMIINKLRNVRTGLRQYIIADMFFIAQNIVSSAVLANSIDNSKFFDVFQTTTCYRPRRFVAAVHRVPPVPSIHRREHLQKFTMLLFDSGKTIFCGQRNIYEVREQVYHQRRKVAPFECVASKKSAKNRHIERLRRELDRQNYKSGEMVFDLQKLIQSLKHA